MKMQKTSRNGMSKAANDRKIKRIYLTAATVVAAVFVMALPVFADDPLTTINNLSDFVFSAIKAIGAILLGFGIVQIRSESTRLNSSHPTTSRMPSSA